MNRWRVLPGCGSIARRDPDGVRRVYRSGDELVGTANEVRGYRDKLELLEEVEKPVKCRPWVVPHQFDGNTVVVLGGGQSLGDVDPGLWRGVYPSVATNEGFRFGTDYLFFQDKPFYDRNRADLAESPVEIVTTCAQLRHEPRVHFVERARVRNLAISDDPAVLPTTTNTGHGSINLAYLLGASRIVLLGFDGRANGNWYENNPSPANEQTFKNRFRPSIERAYAALVERGIDVVNATPGSALNLPTTTPEKALC